MTESTVLRPPNLDEKIVVIDGNPVSHAAYGIALVSRAYIAEATANGSCYFVEYDPSNDSHANIRPGDVHDGKGSFAPPTLTEDHKVLARQIVDGHAGHRRGLARMAHLEHDDQAVTDKALAEIAADHKTHHAAIDSATTVDELPVHVCGYRNHYDGRREKMRTVEGARELLTD